MFSLQYLCQGWRTLVSFHFSTYVRVGGHWCGFTSVPISGLEDTGVVSLQYLCQGWRTLVWFHFSTYVRVGGHWCGFTSVFSNWQLPIEPITGHLYEH